MSRSTKTGDEVPSGVKHETDEATSIVVQEPEITVTKSLLTTCHQISKLQPITDLFLWNVECEDLTQNEVPIMSRNAKLLTLWKCHLPQSF